MRKRKGGRKDKEFREKIPTLIVIFCLFLVIFWGNFASSIEGVIFDYTPMGFDMT